METLIQKLFDIQFELTMIGADLDEKINRLQCQPGIHSMVQSESRNLILMAANIKYNIKVIKLVAANKSQHQDPDKEFKDAVAAMNDIESLYYDTFKNFVLLMEKLEANSLNKDVEVLVRSVWSRLGETYQQFRKIMSNMEQLIESKN